MSKTTPTLKELVSKNRVAHFVKYRAGYIYYDVGHFIFPIPIEDTGDGTFPRAIKAVTLMRWIRKRLMEINND